MYMFTTGMRQIKRIKFEKKTYYIRKNIKALMKCEDHTKQLIKVLPYNFLYQNKGNNSSVKGSILTKLIGYRESMVLMRPPQGGLCSLDP